VYFGSGAGADLKINEASSRKERNKLKGRREETNK